MTTKSFMQDRATELSQLMMALSAMANAAQRGEPVPALTPEQTRSVILTVGEALLANHRELRAAEDPQLRAA
jgi:hypothetical protein